MKDVIEAAHALREQGIAHVVISLGAEGALWVNASGEWIAKPTVSRCRKAPLAQGILWLVA